MLSDAERNEYLREMFSRTHNDLSDSEPAVAVAVAVASEQFTVRRSLRLLNPPKDKQATFLRAILSNTCDGVRMEPSIGDKGRGVVATRHFAKGDFVLQYKGELISRKDALYREEQYKCMPGVGSYMFHFLFDGKKKCIDATIEDDGNLARLANHDRCGTCRPVLFTIKGAPRIILLAATDIATGTEITYDYFDRDRETIKDFPWLA